MNNGFRASIACILPTVFCGWITYRLGVDAFLAGQPLPRGSVSFGCFFLMGIFSIIASFSYGLFLWLGEGD